MRAHRYEALKGDESEDDTIGSVKSAHFGPEKDPARDAGSLEQGVRDDHGQAATVVSSRPGALEIQPTAELPGSHQPARRPSNASKKVVAWRDLPRKDQLLVLTLARLSEPLAQTSLQAYMFYQLQWFDPSLPDSVISSQAGILHASFTAAQFCTAMIWGKVADSELVGRKFVLLIGLLGTLISCVGFGFATTFYQALFFRCLGGATNGNIGVMRTMISEVVRQKKYQSRAFLILPMTFNIGVIIGPVLGGVLSDPAGSYPDVFGNVDFFKKFPYATPNLISAMFLFVAAMLCWTLLEETHDSLRDQRDIGILLGRKLCALFRRRKDTIAYKPVHSRDTSIGTVSTVSTDLELSPVTPRDSLEGRHGPSTPLKTGRRYTQRLPFRRIFTPNVTCTLVAHFFLAFHVGTFNSLWFVFLSTPVYDPSNPSPPDFVPNPPLRFTGGLGWQPRAVGLAMALLGAIGITLQLFLYPRLSARLGTVKSWRACLALFPCAYVLLPFLSLVPSDERPPASKSGVLIWAAVSGVLLIQVTARTFALPAQTILVNNCTPHPSVLGTVHGLGQSASSAARTIGPMLCGWLYGVGLSRGLVGGVFWGLAAVALGGFAASFFVKEGDGHEVWLEGDEEGDE
ncbi:MFS general substrate transporter [Xylariomycetidae sp. FL0641]|nr:MFS general substrate transporter [Xylariomycetidae sp. FL0641]